MMLHGMFEQDTMMDADALKQSKLLASNGKASMGDDKIKALMLAQGLNQ